VKDAKKNWGLKENAGEEKKTTQKWCKKKQRAGRCNEKGKNGGKSGVNEK